MGNLLFFCCRPRSSIDHTNTQDCLAEGLWLTLACRFPNVPVKCWAYCPPGGLVTPGLSTAMQPFCTSVVVGKVSEPPLSPILLPAFMNKLNSLAAGKEARPIKSISHP